MNTSQTGFLSEILAGGKLSQATLGYFRERFRNRIHQFVLKQFIAKQKDGLTQADVARILDKRPEQIHRWLGTPGNWTLDTVSDLMLAISKAELEFLPNLLAGRAVRNHRVPDWLDATQVRKPTPPPSPTTDQPKRPAILRPPDEPPPPSTKRQDALAA